MNMDNKLNNYFLVFFFLYTLVGNLKYTEDQEICVARNRFTNIYLNLLSNIIVKLFLKDLTKIHGFSWHSSNQVSEKLFLVSIFTQNKNEITQSYTQMYLKEEVEVFSSTILHLLYFLKLLWAFKYCFWS